MRDRVLRLVEFEPGLDRIKARRAVGQHGEELQRGGGKLALATMCIGVGQGIALALEKV